MDLYTINKSIITSALVFSLACINLQRADASGCSPGEFNQINTAITQIQQASMYGQLDLVFRLTQELNYSISTMSPGCQQALLSMSPGSYGGYGGSQGGEVYDHGDGGFSTAGVYCGSSGCVGP